MEQLQLTLPKVMSAKTKDIVYDQHIVDYIEFNDELMRWHDENERLRQIRLEENKQWVIKYVREFPLPL